VTGNLNACLNWKTQIFHALEFLEKWKIAFKIEVLKGILFSLYFDKCRS
jgi:hypothetical protein